MTLRDELVQQALSLTPEDRAFLVDVLDQSLAGTGFATPEIATAWAQELDQRIGAYMRSKTTGLPFKTSIERIHQRVIEIRNGQASS